MEKNHIVSSIIIILIIFSSIICTIPSTQASEATMQQKGLSVCSSVLGIDTTKYDVIVEKNTENCSISYMDVIPQQSIIYRISDQKNQQILLYTFANENLQMIRVLEEEGVLSLSEPISSSNILSAKIFLTNYQKFTGERLFDDLKSTLNDVNGKSNLTKTSGNFQLEVTCLNDGITNFKWYYTANGGIAPYSKFIAIAFKNGCFLDYINNWQFYTVGDTTVKLTKEEAAVKALEVAKAYAINANLTAFGFEEKNMNASSVLWSSLIFDNSIDANEKRSDDLLTLFPDWRVGIALDKFYYDGWYGIEVDVWADTGEVRSVQVAKSTLPLSQNSSAPVIDNQKFGNEFVFPLSIIIVITVAILALTSATKKLPFLCLKSIHKTCSTLFVILLSILLVSTIFTACIGTVSATTRGAAIWGSESSGSYDSNLVIPPNTQQSWRKTYNETVKQQLTASYIAPYFSNNGYTGNNGINHQGTSSSKTQICTDFLTLSNNNDYVAFVTFDHGVTGHPLQSPINEQHYMFEDNYGTIFGTYAEYANDQAGHTDCNSHGVFDMSVYYWTQQNEVCFAFINTCLSANVNLFGDSSQGMLPPDGTYNARPRGMPFAFTHRLVKPTTMQGFNINDHISNDGFGSPDNGGQVYIGFPSGSASLYYNLPESYSGGQPYYYWVVHFFYHALSLDESVNSALNSASVETFGSTGFNTSPLRTGFHAIWPMWQPGTGWYIPSNNGCTMAVYGNGGIHLKNYTPP